VKQIDPPGQPFGDAVVIEARRAMRADPVPGETTQDNVDRLRRTIAAILTERVA